MTFSDFQALATSEYQHHKDTQRFGQFVFNELNLIRPDIASELMDTGIDPFYKTHISHDVWLFIQARW